MRYYKLEDGADKTVSIWQVRHDGMERCIYDSCAKGDIGYSSESEWGIWRNPITENEVPIPEDVKVKDVSNFKRITKADAILEMI
jgi:hypothetical protein